MASEALAGRLRIWLLGACCLLFAGCSANATRVTVAWTIDPAPPVAGADTVVHMRLSRAEQPLRGARLRLDAHMTHPGMRPIEADVAEEENGSYRSRLRLSMAGDWLLVVTGTLPDGRRIVDETRVAGVLPALPPVQGQ